MRIQKSHPKISRQQIRKRNYKTLRTSVINSPMSSLSLWEYTPLKYGFSRACAEQALYRKPGGMSHIEIVWYPCAASLCALSVVPVEQMIGGICHKRMVSHPCAPSHVLQENHLLGILLSLSIKSSLGTILVIYSFGYHSNFI